MRPESILTQLGEVSDTSIYKTMQNADQTFRTLISFGVPIQYAIHTGGAKPIIIDSDDIAVIEADSNLQRLEFTLQDYHMRLKRNEGAFSQFIADRCQRTSSATPAMMQLDVGWAFFYWCTISRLYQENRIPTQFSYKANRTYFRGAHV